MKTNKLKLISVISLLSLLVISICLASFYVLSFTPIKTIQDGAQAAFIAEHAKQHISTELEALPYATIPAQLALQTHSVILIDAANDCILYEKNADAIIPPASMTKLFVMYLVFEAIERGEVSLNEPVPLRPESWAINAPPGSSLMFLGEGQRVNLDELLSGLAVVSGNDAAVAVAQHLSGSVPAFIEKMNALAQSLGLKHTHFVDTSGYSELNQTTARDFLKFCSIYVKKFPESLERYHSLTSFTYPKEENLKPGLSYSAALQTGTAYNGTLPITQRATNPLFGKIAGVDGIKTGYIDESGFNLALSIKRDGTRFLAVLMGGPGIGTVQGNQIRTRDVEILTDWAYKTFKSFTISDTIAFNMPLLYGQENSILVYEAINKEKHALSVPLIAHEPSIRRQIAIEPIIKAPVKENEILGYVYYFLGDILLETRPLIAANSVDTGSRFKTSVDGILLPFIAKRLTKAPIDRLQELYRNPQIELQQ